MPDGTVTIVMDADTSRYFAKLVELADKSKKLKDGPEDAAKSMQKLGGFASDVLATFTKFALPISAAGAALAVLESEIEGWDKKVQQIRSSITEGIKASQAQARVGLSANPQVVQDIIKASGGRLGGFDEKGGLKEDAAIALINAVKAGGVAPNATAEQIAAIAPAAGRAQALGMDSAKFGAAMMKMQNAGVRYAQDLVFFLQQKISPAMQETALSQAIRVPQHAAEIFAAYANASTFEGRGMGGAARARVEAGIEQWERKGFKGELPQIIGQDIGENRRRLRKGTAEYDVGKQLEKMTLGQPEEGAFNRAYLDYDRQPGAVLEYQKAQSVLEFMKGPRQSPEEIQQQTLKMIKAENLKQSGYRNPYKWMPDTVYQIIESMNESGSGDDWSGGLGDEWKQSTNNAPSGKGGGMVTGPVVQALERVINTIKNQQSNPLRRLAPDRQGEHQ